MLCFASVALIRLLVDMFSQLPIDSLIMSKFIVALELSYPLLPLAMKSNSQLLDLSGGEAELVKVSEIGFKLGDVPCIFGEYKVEEAILLGDPIPESTECGWILFWPVTAPLPLGNWPLIEPGKDERTVEFPWFVRGPGWPIDCCPLIPFPDGLLTGVTIADPLLATVVMHVLFAEIVTAEDTAGPWPEFGCAPLFPVSFDSNVETGKLAGGWNPWEDKDVLDAFRCSMATGEFSSIFIEFPENVMIGESQDFDEAELLVGFTGIDEVGFLTSLQDESWELGAVVIVVVDVEQGVAEELLEFGDMDGML